MSTVATIHPALLAVRETPEHKALCADFVHAAAQTYGGEAWAQRRRAAQSAILRLERIAVDNWGAGLSCRATCTDCDVWSVPLAFGDIVAWIVKHAKRCGDESIEVRVCGHEDVTPR